MVPDILYDLAFAFRKLKLWTKLYDSQLFALRHSDGMVGYCCVMGRMGEHFALAEYPGVSGLDAFQKMHSVPREMDFLDEHELMMAQDCLMVSFQSKSMLKPREVTELDAYVASHGLKLRGKNACPQFERFRPHFFPWRLDDETDWRHLAEALEAALEVSSRLLLTTPDQLGFTEGAPFERSIPLLEKVNEAFTWGKLDLGQARRETYVSPEFKDDISLAKLAKSKKKGGEWACSIFMSLEAVSDEAEDDDAVEDPVLAPYFPYILLVLDNESGMILDMQTVKELDDTLPILRSLIQLVQKVGKPKQILVPDDRTKAFFLHLAPALGAKLLKRKSIPFLAEARQHFAEQFDWRDDEKNEIMDMLAILTDPEAYPDMPDEMLLMLAQAVESNDLPYPIPQLIQKECKRRNL